MIVTMVREFRTRQGNGGVDQGRIRNWDACNDAGHIREYSDHDCRRDGVAKGLG
jgi:hypothetical protein